MRASIFQLICFMLLLCADQAWANNSHFQENLAKGVQPTMDLIKKDRWVEARRLAVQSKNPVLPTVVAWLYIKDAKTKPTFDEITQFVHANPRWPDLYMLRRKAEHALDPSIPAIKIRKWFAKYPPITAHGALIYAEAKAMELAQKKSEEEIPKTREEVVRLKRLHWVRADFSRKQEEEFFKKHKKILRQDDVKARIERLLEERKHHAAEGLLPLLSSAHQALYRVRLALQQNHMHVDDLMKKVPQSLQKDRGLLFDLAKYKQKHDQEEDLMAILKDAPRSLPHSEKWWLVKHRHIRWLLKNKRYQDAYILAKHHGLQQGKDFADGEWIAGWISLRFLNDPRTSYRHFYQLYQKVKFPISLARAAYWAGRAAEANGNKKISQDWYRLGAKYPDAFYGQLSILKINQTQDLKLPVRPATSKEDIKAVESNKLIQAACVLMHMKYYQDAKNFVRNAITQTHKPGQIAYMVDLVGKNNHALGMSVALAKHAAQYNVMIKDKNYPVSTHAVTNSALDKHLTHAIIRQESNFDSYAKSSAGAMGLMQLMPETARLVAKEIQLKYAKNKLSVPAYNIELGANHMQQLLKEFNGSYILSLAAYNGGGHHVKRWLMEYGDPRDKENVEDIIDWMELIPFGETRNYVQRVLENVQIYRALLSKHGQPVGGLVTDLKRGN